ncbi:MAG: isoprenylcysteine carboxylmethyltransferase family protein [Bacillota bacterium]|jgi:protein-S-isoprenylcysteine O-methyltransferase Ste14
MFNTRTGLNIHGVRGIIREIVMIFGGAAILFVASGNFSWVGAWTYLILVFLYQLSYIVTLLLINPALLNERAKLNWKESKGYDRCFLVLYPVGSFLTLLVAGLDFRLHGATIMIFPLRYVGVLLFVFSSVLAFWAFVSNSNFILTHRTAQVAGQQLCSVGPYHYIRHPGYLSAVISTAAFPLLIGSLLSAIPVLATIGLIVYRTAREDQTLKAELSGYVQYSKKVKYKLVPFLW